jgi:hypothetical protein
VNLFRSLLKRLFGPGHSRPSAGSRQVSEVAAPPFAVINRVPLTNEEPDKRVGDTTEPPKQQQPAEQPASCHALKLIGYWAPLPQWEGLHSAYAEKQPPWPDIRRAGPETGTQLDLASRRVPPARPVRPGQGPSSPGIATQGLGRQSPSRITSRKSCLGRSDRSAQQYGLNALDAGGS